MTTALPNFMLKDYVKHYVSADYVLSQLLFVTLACFGVFGHALFYILLALVTDYYESFVLRLFAILMIISLLLLPRYRTLNSIQGWYYEFVLMLIFPCWFTWFLVMNDVNLYWTISIMFASIPYGLLSNPLRALILYPLGVALALVLLQQHIGVTSETVRLVLLLNLPAYFMVFLLGGLQTTIKLVFAQLSELNSKVEYEQERSEKLLDAIFPKRISDRLKEGESLIADSHGEVAVLFADLIGFSHLTNVLSPTHLVELLNKLFSEFDEIAVRYSVEKIKTIGDGYMVVSGLLPENHENTVESIADFGLEAIGLVGRFSVEHDIPLSLRIGISTGPVISGVIGTEKPTFDLWGRTVNLASRMETTGEEDKIQVCESTYWRLKEHYLFEENGPKHLKGFEPLNTFFLISKNA